MNKENENDKVVIEIPNEDVLFEFPSRGLENKKELLEYKSILDIKDLMNGKFGYKEGELSTTLDIISIYLKGQKNLYLEAKSYSEFYLNRLMMPCILLSSISSVISGIFNEIPLAGKIIAGTTALSAFLMSLISYFKLDARAEAHKMTAYSFDQLISECEFTSGKILLNNTSKSKKIEENNEENDEENKKKNIEIYDIQYIQNFLNNIEKRVKEIKEKNQFIIPDVIRKRYNTIYNNNIFTSIKQFQIDELILLNQLKIAYNDCRDIENKIIKSDKSELSQEDYKLYRKLYLTKEDFFHKVIIYRKKILETNKKLFEEIENNKNESCCKIFY